MPLKQKTQLKLGLPSRYFGSILFETLKAMGTLKGLLIGFVCLCIFLFGIIWLERIFPKEYVILFIGFGVWLATIWYYKTKDKKRLLRAGRWVSFAREVLVPDNLESGAKIKVPKGTLAILKRDFLPKDYSLTAWANVVVQTEGVNVYFEKSFADKGNPRETYELFKDPWLFHLATPSSEVKSATLKAMKEHKVFSEKLWKDWGIDFLDYVNRP